jgi:SAM-dependent methyltransferase
MPTLANSYKPDKPRKEPDITRHKDQRWKTDPSLHSCERKEAGNQTKKKLDYDKVYIEEFLNTDPVRDWESIDRCQILWHWMMERVDENPAEWEVLDVGSKDGQFPQWLIDEHLVEDSIGCEISEDYLEWCRQKKRPVVYGNACDLPQAWEGKFDCVFSHHLLGLTPDYLQSLDEMFNCVKPGGYMITLNDVPGNPRKHYSYIENPSIFKEFCDKWKDCTIIYNDRWNSDFPKEWVLLVKRGK